MRFKELAVLALGAMLVAMGSCGDRPSPASSEAVTVDPAGVTLVPYTSGVSGIKGVAPRGWVEVKPGQFQRMPGSDPTLLAQVAFPGAIMEQVTGQWQLPERVGSRDTGPLSWDLYGAELEWPDAGTLGSDIALAEGDSGVYLVILVTLGDEHEALHDTVFAPAVGALAPLMAAGEWKGATHPLPTADGSAPIDTRMRATDGMTMIYVPAGEFRMGHPGVQWVWGGSLLDGDWGLQVFSDEQPLRTVHLDDFWIDQTEVTVGMFRSFVEATGYETTAEREGWGSPWRDGPMEEEWPQVRGADWRHPRGPESSAQDDHPVVQVSWKDAAAYCQWAGGHLPTEVQWEKAARGIDGRSWPWGDAYDGARGNFCNAECPIKRWRREAYDDGYAFTAPVGSFPDGASPYGALDMAGNVWE